MAKHQAPVATREPAVVIGTVSGIVAAILALIIAFGGSLSDDQQAAIMGVVAALAPIVSGILTRRKVTPVDSDGTPLPQD